MACELELDNVDRLANVISQKVVQMEEPSAWPNCRTACWRGPRMVFTSGWLAKAGRVEASMYVDRYAWERIYKLVNSRKLA
jgi:hypothetical protein